MPAVRGRPSWASRIRFRAQVFALVLLHALLMPGANAELNAQGACPPPYRRGSPDLPVSPDFTTAQCMTTYGSNGAFPGGRAFTAMKNFSKQ